MLDLSLSDRIYQFQQTRRLCVNVFHAPFSPFHLHFFYAPYLPTGNMLDLPIRAESTRRSPHVCEPLSYILSFHLHFFYVPYLPL